MNVKAERSNGTRKYPLPPLIKGAREKLEPRILASTTGERTGKRIRLYLLVRRPAIYT